MDRRVVDSTGEPNLCFRSAERIGANDARHREHLVALARQLTSSASLKSKGAPSERSALAEWPVSPRESVNSTTDVTSMAEQYRIDQSPSRVSGSGVVIRQEITIINELGLHARPAAEFVLAAKAFRSQVWLVKGEERFSAASILEVLCANLNCGDTAIQMF
jgi:phosphotransferase system HPr (HPr) family protein